MIRFAINEADEYLKQKKKEGHDWNMGLYRTYYLSSVYRDRAQRMEIVPGRGARRPLNFTGCYLTGRQPMGDEQVFMGRRLRR